MTFGNFWQPLLHTFHLLLFHFFTLFRPSPPPFCQLSFLFPSFLSSSLFVTIFFCPLFSIYFIVSDPPYLLLPSLCILSLPSVLFYSLFHPIFYSPLYPSSKKQLVYPQDLIYIFHDGFHPCTTSFPFAFFPSNQFIHFITSAFPYLLFYLFPFAFSSIFLITFLLNGLFRPFFPHNNLSTYVIFPVLYDFQPLVCWYGSLCLMVVPVER